MKAEEALQRAVVQLLALYEQRDLLAFAHVPNGERRDPVTGGRLKAMGVRAGVPDLLLWIRGGRALGIELKAGLGKISPEQMYWHARVSSLGHRVYVCRSVDEVEAVLRIEGVPAVGKIDGRAPERLPDAFSGPEGTRGRVGGDSSPSTVRKSEPA